MANTLSYVLANYRTDFGQLYDITFKANPTNLDRSGIPFDRNTDSICSTGRLFKPRKLIVTFNDGASVEVPVASIGLVPAIASTILGQSDVACVALRGERWVSIPPAILGGSYATTGFAGEAVPEKESVFYTYDLEGGSQLLLRTSIELGSFNGIQRSCITEAPTALACAGGSGVRPRRFKGERFNTTTEGKISKQVIVSSASETEIRDCGEQIMNDFNCLGYQGTSIANVENFFTAVTP